MGSFNTSKPAASPPDGEDAERLAVSCLHEGRYAEAFLLLESGGEGAGCCFHRGLCFLEAGDFESAAASLERALTALRTAGGGPSSPGGGLSAADASPALPKSPAAAKTAAYIALRQKQLAARDYLRPMSREYLARFPAAAKENITLALADALRGCGLNDRAAALVRSLSGEEFSDIKRQA